MSATEPNNGKNVSNKSDHSTDTSDSSDSDEGSDSSSESTSSTSNDDTAQNDNRTQTPQFSVMRSDGGGLRMKISAIPPNTIRANNNNNSVKKDTTTITASAAKPTKTQQKKTKKKHRTDLSSSSCCSACTESDSDSSSVGSKQNLVKKTAKLKPPNKRPEPVNSSGGSGVEDGSDEESSRSSKQPSLSKNKKSNSAKTASEGNKVTSVRTAAGNELVEDGGSSSDMELPALVNAVNAAIQRVESSDSESTKNETSKSQYTSSLLHDFMVKTQMLGTSATEANDLKQSNENASKIGEQTSKFDKESKAESSTIAPAKRKRGRPKKLANSTVEKGPLSESPDSGIISTPHSPVNTEDNKISPAKVKDKPIRRKSINKKIETNTTSTASAPKLNIASLEKSMYATERVLYPPRHKRRNVSAALAKSAAEDLLDPVWRKIDINKKFRRPSVSGYKSDGGSSTICSKILAAQSNYVTDYGTITQRYLSGYKSDYSCKSKRSGYKSDFSVKAKSCGYRSDCSSKFRKKIRRKRRTKFANSKSTVNETDILQLAGLSLGQSEESSRDSVNRSTSNSSMKNAKSSKSVLGAQSLVHRSRSMTSGKEILNNLCERVTKRLSGLDNPPSLKSSSLTSVSLSDIYKRSISSTFPKVGMIRSRRPSAVSHCSSRSGCSRQHFRRRRRKRLKSQSRTNVPKINFTKLNMQIEVLTNSFSSLCRIGSEKSTKEKTDSVKPSSSKRMIKKRKQSELIDSAGAPSAATTTTKRRHKKQTQTQSPDDHKLPLKKRQYLMTSGEKNPDGTSEPKSKEDDSQSKTNSNSKIATAKAVTPKKRHLLETPFAQGTSTAAAAAQNQSDLLSIVSDTNSSQESLIEPLPESLQLKYQQIAKKNDILTRKKNRLEGLVSKIMPNLQSSGDSTSSSSSSSKQSSSRPSSSVKNTPPPGVFEPSIDLELQIPATTIPAIVAKTEIDSPRTLNEALAKLIKDEPSSKTEKVVETLLNKTGGHLLLKKKRKKQNRTGFPTIRKKKKKSTDTDTPTLDTKPLDLEVEMYGAATIITKVLNPAALVARVESMIADNCDRVPKTGEAAATFIERNSRPRLSVVSLEKLQGKPLQQLESNEDKTTPEVGKQKQKSKTNAEPNKRCRDSSTETAKIVKKYKSDSIGKDVSSKTAKKQAAPSSSRDVSSDNEPLINFVNKANKQNSEQIIEPKDDSKQKNAPKSTTTTAAKKMNKKESSKTRNTKCSTTGKVVEQPDTEQLKAQVNSLPEKSSTKDANSKTDKIDNHSIQIKSTSIQAEQQKSTVKSSATNKTGTKGKRVAAANNEKPPATLAEIERKSKLAVVKLKLISNIETLVKNPTKNGSTSEVNNEIDNSEKPKEPAVEKDSEKNAKKKRGRRKNSIPKVESVSQRAVDPILPQKLSIELETKPAKSTAKTTTKTTAKPTTKEQTPTISVDSTDIPRPANEPEFDAAEVIIKPFEEIDDPCEHDPLPIAEGPSIFPTEITSDSSTSTEPSSKKSLKLRKKYLCAGLFSDSFKDSMCKSSDKSISRNYVPEEYPEGLLPAPLYCEKFFRRSTIDFQLPFDLWTAHENGKLPGRNSVPSWNYRKIRTNVYNDVRAVLSTDQQSCSCKPDSGCGDDCLNRLMYTECTVKTCPCADKCQNTKIQRHIIAPGVERFMTENKGWGVKTKLPITKGTYISEYVGEIVTEKEFKERMATLYIRDTHHYCLNLDGGLVIDGHRMGSDCRFVNHSCSPNCEMQKWSVNGLFRMALFAMRNIEPGEELTYDYNFSLFNPTEGQPCRCETPQCRGVIGGKSQRVKPIDIQATNKTTSPNNKGRTGRPRKNQANKNQSFMHRKDTSKCLTVTLPTSKEQIAIINGHCFLLRNLKKIRRLKQSQVQTYHSTPATLTAHISALRTPRNIKTRGVTIAEHDPTIEKTARIAGILREICEELANHKDSAGQCLIAKLNLPSKKKCPQFYEKIKKPIDLSMIEINVEKGLYKHPGLFDDDVLRMLSNAVKYYGNTSNECAAAQSLLEVYSAKKQNVVQRLSGILGSENNSLSSFLPSKPNQLLLKVDPNEDIIRCICGLFKDEGLMIQCSKCLVWQHTECTGADTSIDNYSCERCDGRKVDLEIKLDDYTDEGYRYYLSLMRGDSLQIRQTDTVYVLRDIPIKSDNPTEPIKKHTYKTIGKIDFTECDIFRVERLWKDGNGKRFVFGHHYLRPHETYHEPSRKFYPNEVVRVPLYEVVPIDLIMGRCWVMDPTTYCKGRPVDCNEKHVYICELRVDKAARLFSKIQKHQYPICQKSYAFHKFEQKLKISRNFLPHEVKLALTKPKRKKHDEPLINVQRKNTTPIVQLMPPPPKTLNEKRTRLEGYLSKLMTKLKSQHENMQPLNLSYLLTGRGTRRRANTANVPQL